MLKPQRGKGFGSMKKGNVLDGAVVTEDVTEELSGSCSLCSEGCSSALCHE